MKNYKKLYNHLIKTLKSELKMAKQYVKPLDNRSDLVDKIECEGKIDLLNWFFKDYLPELEGRKWDNMCFNENEWDEWKKEINE